MPVTIEVNGERHTLEVEPTRRLLGVLRDELALTGAKLGCGEGACGACAVLLDGAPAVSCLLPVGAVEGRSVTTNSPHEVANVSVHVFEGSSGSVGCVSPPSSRGSGASTSWHPAAAPVVSVSVCVAVVVASLSPSPSPPQPDAARASRTARSRRTARRGTSGG